MRKNAKKCEEYEEYEKKSKKSEKSEKSEKKRKNRLEFRFALFHFEKQKLPKRSEAKNLKRKEAKRSEKREVKFYSEIVKHKWNGSKFALFRL